MIDPSIDYSFINCDFPYSEFIKAAYEAHVDQERKMILSLLIQYIDFIVFSGAYPFIDSKYPVNARFDDERLINYGKIPEALDAVRYCLRDRICQDISWDWLLRVMIGLDRYSVAAFTVHIFCPLVTGPISMEDEYRWIAFDRFLQRYRDPSRKWAVLEGFTESTFEQAKNTIEHYNQLRCERSLDPLIVDYTELEKYLKDN
jgi:hypothetical protein